MPKVAFSFYNEQLRHIVVETLREHISIDEMVNYFQTMILNAYDSGYAKGLQERIDNVRLKALRKLEKR